MLFVNQTNHQVPATRDKATLEGAVKEKYFSVGFSRLGEADHAFGFECPRGRWVHLAFVASAPPKRRVSLFADGRMVGFCDERCKLPMHYLGGKDQAAQCSLQEVRIWKSARSRTELLVDMHQCLDFKALKAEEAAADAAKAAVEAAEDRGLTKEEAEEEAREAAKAAAAASDPDGKVAAAPKKKKKGRRRKGGGKEADSSAAARAAAVPRIHAYFGFEEGQGHYASDWTDAFPRQRLHGCSWDLERSCGIDEKDWNFPPTPSVRERDVCRVALRRLRLAQRARQRQLPVACECGITVPGNWMHVHKLNCTFRKVSSCCPPASLSSHRRPLVFSYHWSCCPPASLSYYLVFLARSSSPPSLALAQSLP